MAEPEEKEESKTSEAVAQDNHEMTEQKSDQKTEMTQNPQPKKKYNLKLIIGIAVGVLVILFILAMIFGSPSAKTVFKDMNSKMLKTNSVTVDVSYKGTMSQLGQIDMSSRIYLDMSSQQTLKSKGSFKMNIVSSNMPITIEADYIVVGDSKYIKFNKLSSTSPELSSTFSQVESKLKNEWIKTRSQDNYTSFVEVPLETVLVVLPTPYANLSSDQSKNVLSIMHEDSTYKIEESSKVELGSNDAYKYSLTYNKDKYNQFAKLITGYMSYFKTSSNEGSDITSYDVWVNSSTKQILKIEFVGSSNEGNVDGKMTFSNYDQTTTVNKPEDYSIESELLL